MKSLIAAASVAVMIFASQAGAASITKIDKNSVVGTFGGLFDVTAVNVTNLNSAQSRATRANFDAALAGTLGDGDESFASDTFAYSGLLDFARFKSDPSHIGSFIGSGTGSATGLDPVFAALTNSQGNINKGTAITTFYLFESTTNYSAGTFDIGHDDGVLIEGVAGSAGPTSLRGSRIEGFAGGPLSLLYVSTNSNPSILRVDSTVAPVPLPAAAWMLLAGIGAMFGMSAKRRMAG